MLAFCSPFDWTADAPGASSSRNLRAFRALVLAHWAVQCWAFFVKPLEIPITFPPMAIAVVAGVLTILSLLAFTPRGRLACALALPLAAWTAWWTFPFTPNHTFLVLVMLALFAWLDPEQEGDAGLLIRTIRWLAIIVFFYAGLQKLLHGLYFRGEFLIWMIAHGVERWADVFGWMIPQEELDRLASYPRFALKAGPYRVDSLLFVVAANAVWIGEMAAAVGMILRRTRELAALAAIGLVFIIQLAPREFMFALLYTQVLLLFVRGEWNRRLLPLFLFAYWYLLAMLLGAPGGDIFLKASKDL